MNFSMLRLSFLLGFSAALAACGGSSGSGSPDGGGDPLVGETSFQVSTQLNGGNAAITPESADVDAGASLEIEVVPEIGYWIEAVDGCGGVLDAGTYTTGAISEDCTVTVTLATLSAPELTLASGNQSVLISWEPMEGATEYDLYYASESIVDIGNYGAYNDAGLVIGAESPHRVLGLENDKTYFFRAIARAEPGESLAGLEVSATPEALSFPIGGLNDTGQDTCATNDEKDLACPQAGFLNQDGDIGRDAAARAGTLDKIGAGSGGFDFTKLDGDGESLADDAADWSCIRDNVTGLIWERKLAGSEQRGTETTYRWYNPDPTANAGNAGKETDNFHPDRESTYDYLNYLKGIELCGFDDWRLPRVYELRSIVDRGRQEPAIDTDYFRISGSYRQIWASALAANPSSAWLVDFGHGRSNTTSKNNYRAVLAVRGGE